MKEIFIITAMYIVEAFHDYYVIQDAKGYGPKWHKADLIFHALIMLLVYVTTSNYLIALLVFTARWLFFNSILNILRNKKIYYRGERETIEKRIDSLLFIASLIAYIINVYLIIKL